MKAPAISLQQEFSVDGHVSGFGTRSAGDWSSRVSAPFFFHPVTSGSVMEVEMFSCV